MFLFSEEILSWFLGARWSAAGQIVEIMAPYLYVLWVGSLASTVFETLRLNKLRLITNIGSLLTRVATFVACGVLSLDIFQTLWAYVIVSSAYQMAIYGIAAREAMRHDTNLRSLQVDASGLENRSP